MTLFGLLAAYAAALVSNGPTWCTPPKLAVAAVAALSIMSASIYHYGRRHDVYAKKWWDLVLVRNPPTLIAIGRAGFLASILIAAIYLPAVCVAIAVGNALVIFFYADYLDKYWPYKNLAIAAICVTPLLLGWLAGHRYNPIMPPAIGATFFIYLAREVLKDINDLEANRGKRFTTVMSLGMPACYLIASTLIILALFFVGLVIDRLPPSPWIMAVFFLGGGFLVVYAAQLLTLEKAVARRYKQIDVAVILMILGLFLVRWQMY